MDFTKEKIEEAIWFLERQIAYWSAGNSIKEVEHLELAIVALRKMKESNYGI